MRIRDLNWRAMSGMDMAAVDAIAAAVHPTLFETPAVLDERRALYPHGAHLLELGERPVGYVLSHPWLLGTLPALNAPLGALPEAPDTYYIHDLALLPLVRRVGAATAMVVALMRHAEARGFATLSLVAVAGSQGFWERHGFVETPAPELEAKLAGYGEGARLMMRHLVP